MRSFARVFALLTLFGWLFAAGHVALEHGGVADGGAWETLFAEDGHGHDHDHDDADHHGVSASHEAAPSHGEEHHEHDLAALGDGVWLKTTEKVIFAPVLLPLLAILGEMGNGWGAEPQTAGVEQVWEHAPPDERASGWLLVCHTALPVRGPSIVA